MEDEEHRVHDQEHRLDVLLVVRDDVVVVRDYQVIVRDYQVVVREDVLAASQERESAEHFGIRRAAVVAALTLRRVTRGFAERGAGDETSVERTVYGDALGVAAAAGR